MLDKLASSINDGKPLVLFLGQDAWKNEAGNDYVLNKAQSKFNIDISNGYKSLLSSNLEHGFYTWLAGIYDQQPEPLWIETLSKLPLNAVFTSSINPSINKAFRKSGREVELVLSSSDNPATPRNKRLLHLTYLFGRAGETSFNESPPATIAELRTRRALHTNILLTRIIETSTSLGTVLIDGLNLNSDWIDTENFAGVLSALPHGQVFWFGQKEDNLLELGIPAGAVTFIEHRLSKVLELLEATGRIDISTPKIFGSSGIVSLDNRVLEIDPSMRLKVSATCSIVEDDWITVANHLGPDSDFAEFRRFHGFYDDARKLIEGIQRGYTIERTIEDPLIKRVKHALNLPSSRNQPIIVHGQSSVGKSLCLAKLAFEIKKLNKYPVLFSCRSSRLPAIEELDGFCLKAEESGAEATLIICDSNNNLERYSEVLKGFNSRGRKVVIVGSSYRLIDNTIDEKSNVNFFELKAELEASEATELNNLLKTFTGQSRKYENSSYFLSSLYRLLPDVRQRLTAGLVNETKVVEQDLRIRAKSTSSPSVSNTVMAHAFHKADLVNPEEILKLKIDNFLNEFSDTASKLIDLVMVPGKLNCPVPISILMRAVDGLNNLEAINKLFSGIDLFRWSTNDDGEFFIHPRLTIEADLICSRRVGSTDMECDVCIELIKNANPTLNSTEERRFVLSLVQKIGPDGPFDKRYSKNYLKVAKALTHLRVSRNVSDPSLMLQEAALRRLSFRGDSLDTSQGSRDMSILDEAREIVELALYEFSEDKSASLRRACANLRVERAAIYGTSAVESLNLGSETEEIWQLYQGVRDATKKALYYADSYYAVDIALWAPSRLLEHDDWTTSQKAELLADIWDRIDGIDPDKLDIIQRQKYEERKFRISSTLNNKSLESSALDALKELGSKAGIYLVARNLGGALRKSGPPTPSDVLNANKVKEFLDSKFLDIQDDSRCLAYYLSSLWIVSTNTFLFGNERSPLPSNDSDLRKILDVLRYLNFVNGGGDDPRNKYLYAVLLWRLDNVLEANQVWFDLDQETSFNDPRRVIRHHVWSDSLGDPVLFHGRVKTELVGKGKAKVFVDEIRQEVDILQRDFPNFELRKNASIIGGFHIAFNFIGPVAIPSKRMDSKT